jgi:hypothetical protein
MEKRQRKMWIFAHFSSAKADGQKNKATAKQTSFLMMFMAKPLA